MRRALFWLLVIGTLAALATTASARTSRLAKLRVVDVSPLTIAGSGFHRGEHVRITATVASVTRTVRTTATPLGAFRILLSDLRVSQGRCEAVRVVAVGLAGTTAVLKRLPSRACLLQRSPA